MILTGSSSRFQNAFVRVCAFGRDTSGASSSEYGILAAIVAIAIIPAIGAAGWKVSQTFAAIADSMPTGSIPAAAVPGTAPSAPNAAGSAPPDSTSPVEGLPPAPMAPEPEVYPIPQ